MEFDRDKFFDSFRDAFGALSQHQVDGLNALLRAIEADPKQSDPVWLSYQLATCYHETAHTMQPIEEYGKGKGHPYGQPDPITLQAYYGRGYVQLTWKANYQKFQKVLPVYLDSVRTDIVQHPEQALLPTIAYFIMEFGMTYGMFTGKKLGDYLNEDKKDYVNARRIINGTDRAELIAGYAETFEGILNDSVIVPAEEVPVAESPTAEEATA